MSGDGVKDFKGKCTLKTRLNAEGVKIHVRRDTQSLKNAKTMQKTKKTSWLRRTSSWTCSHTVWHTHPHTHFFKHKCTRTHSCVLWLCLSACLCWIYQHNPSVFACSIEKWGGGMREWGNEREREKWERGWTLKCMGALASSDKAHNTPASNLIK